MNPDRRTELDGLRAVAIISVLAFHCLRFTSAPHSLLNYVARVPAAGWGGVDIFFVLSGFLVGGILIDRRGQPDQLRNFMIRRCMRIAPLYAAVAASFYVLRAAIEAPWLFSNAVPWWRYATLTQNFAAPALGRDALYLAPTWSLAVEVQIYLLLGVALTRAPSRALLPMMVAGIVIAETCRVAFALTGHGEFGYFATPARIDAACMGVLVAMLVRSGRWRDVASVPTIWLAVSVLSAGAVLAALANQGPGSMGADICTHLALALGASCAISALVVTEGRANRILRAPALVRLGSISYGVYLLHVPAIGIMRTLLGRPGLEIDDGAAALGSGLGVALTITLAGLSYRYFETPLNEWAHRVSRTALPQRMKVA